MASLINNEIQQNQETIDQIKHRLYYNNIKCRCRNKNTPSNSNEPMYLPDELNETKCYVELNGDKLIINNTYEMYCDNDINERFIDLFRRKIKSFSVFSIIGNTGYDFNYILSYIKKIDVLIILGDSDLLKYFYEKDKESDIEEFANKIDAIHIPLHIYHKHYNVLYEYYDKHYTDEDVILTRRLCNA